MCILCVGVTLNAHHYIGTVAETIPVVVRGDDLELEVGPAHVAEHDGTLDVSSIGLDHEGVLALGCGRDDQVVRHGTVVTSVLICSL